MIPESVAVRQRGAFDFASCYDNLCALQSTVPLSTVKAHLANGILDINGDKIRMIDWSPILNTLKINRNLRYVSIKSYFPTNGNSNGILYFKGGTPAIRCKNVTMGKAKVLGFLHFPSQPIIRGVPIRERDLQIIKKNKSLTHLQFDYCQISDNGAKILCHTLKSHPSIPHLSVSGCNITSAGAEMIAKLVKHQATQRHSEAWADGLRYRTPNLSLMSGIRRISLNSNPMISDEGAEAFADALKDDLWLKALDLQHCGISSEGADKIMSTIKHNNTIVVLDIRGNPMVDTGTLRKVLGKVLMNVNGNDENDYPWVKEEPPKDPYRTGKPRRPTRNISRSFTKKQTQKSLKQAAGEEGVPDVYPPGHKSFVPWRTAVRASQHKDTTFSVTGGGDQNPIDQSLLTKRECEEYIKRLKIDLLDAKRRLSMSQESEKKLNNKIMSLEVENSRLRHDLKTSFENSRMRSQIEEEGLLDSIETSFNKFHEFLNTLNDVGLGSLATAAGLD
uniref:Centrosomal protein of 78 kDa n=1 Tax=Ciona intestinalis TaxID=7719 RepID=H2XSH8_CIOIN